MKGVFLVERGRVAICDALPEPACPPQGVVLTTRGGGICGGDLKRYRSHGGPFPLFMGGHEFAGEVIQVGAEVASFHAGDAVVFCFGNACGVCRNCRAGSGGFCLAKRPLVDAGGAFAERMAVLTPAHGCGLFPKPEGLSFAHAAAAEPAGCAVAAVERGRPRPGQWAAVAGLGAIGHFIAQVLCATGVRTIGIDVSESRLRAARPFCLELIDASRQDPVATVLEITGGAGVDQAYEAAGVDATLTAALQLTRVGGTVVLAGVFGQPMKAFHPEWVFRRDLTLMGAKGRPHVTAQGEALVLEYMRRGIIQPETAVTEFPFSQAAAAFGAQQAAECLKAVLVPG